MVPTTEYHVHLSSSVIGVCCKVVRLVLQNLQADRFVSHGVCAPWPLISHSNPIYLCIYYTRALQEIWIYMTSVSLPGLPRLCIPAGLTAVKVADM